MMWWSEVRWPEIPLHWALPDHLRFSFPSLLMFHAVSVLGHKSPVLCHGFAVKKGLNFA